MAPASESNFSLSSVDCLDVFSVRFAKNLGTVFTSAAKCVEEDKFKVFRCFKLWKEGNFFPEDVIGPIVSKINAIESFEQVPSGVDTNAPPGADEVDQQDSENGPKPNSSPIRPNLPSDEKPAPISAVKKLESPIVSTRSAEKVRFDKRLLDFDYSDEEDGEGQRSGTGRRSKRKAAEQEEDFFVVGKDGKPEFAIDKIMSGLRQQRGASQPFSMDAPDSPVPPVMEPLNDENNEMELSSPGPEELLAAAAAEAALEAKPIVLKSCTIWVGHLPKSVSEGELKKAMAEYGAVSTLDLISSRGCAYVSYEKRRHAESALRSRRDFWKQFGEKVKISWGPGRGIKAGYKEWNWDADAGICEIKPSLLPPNCRTLAEGSELMMESVPERVRSRFLDEPEVEQEPLNATIAQSDDASARDVHPSKWETTASVGFAPLETHINTWNALLQAQAAETSVIAPQGPSLPVAFDAIQPPTFPPFFAGASLPPPPGGSSSVSAAPQQNGGGGSAISTIVSGQTSWTDPATPKAKSSLFSKMATAAADRSDPFTSLLAENEPPPINPLFLKPPPPLGVTNAAPSLPPFPTGAGGPAFSPDMLAALIRGQSSNTFGNSGNNNNGRLSFPAQSFAPRNGGGGGGLPIFRLPLSGGPPRFPGLEMNSGGVDGGMRSRFPGGMFGDKDSGVNRFAGPDIRLPLLGNFPGQNMSFGGGSNDGPRRPMWSGDGAGGNFGGRLGNGNFDDRRINFSGGDDRGRNFGGGGNRQNFDQHRHTGHSDDHRRGGFSGDHKGGGFSSNRGDGNDFSGPPFQQRAPR